MVFVAIGGLPYTRYCNIMKNDGPSAADEKVSREIAAALQPFLDQLAAVKFPAPGESAVVALACPKVAALCYDRVWSGINTDVPPDVAFHGSTLFEAKLLLFSALADEEVLLTEFDLDTAKTVAQSAQNSLRDLVAALPYALEPLDRIHRAMCDAIAEKHQISAIPVFSSTDSKEAEYKSGDRSVVVAALRNVPVPVEQQLSWRQVTELRRDKEAKNRVIICLTQYYGSAIMLPS